MKNGELSEYLGLMREFHIKKLNYNGCEIIMHPSGFAPKEIQISEVPLQQDVKNPLNNPMTEDEVLFWSVGGSGFKDNSGKEVPVPLTGEEIEDEADVG